MRIAVVGRGSIGRRHLETLHLLGHDARACRRKPAHEELGSLEEAVAWGAEALVIATPTALHADALRWAVDHGVPTYVEKPLACRAADVAEVVARAEEGGVVVAVGYNLRFHPAVEVLAAALLDGRVGRLLTAEASVGSYLPDWHPDEDYRESYAARYDHGGGALLTLSHELDLLRALCGEIVECTGLTARTSALELDVDDAAAVVCRHESGALTCVRMDMLDRAYNRRSRWVGEDATMIWEWGRGVRIEPGGEWLWVDDGFDLAETYRLALADFADAVRAGRSPRVSGRDGLRIVEVCEHVGIESR